MVTVSNRAILKRIYEALERTKQTPRSASLKAGLGPDGIRNWERDEKILPRIDTLEKLAPVLDLEPEVLAGWAAARRRSGKSETARALKIIGEVAAGLWLEIDALGETEYDAYPVPYHPSYAEEAQYGLIVRGTSMNRIAQPGDVLQCVDIGISGLSPREDDLVIVERRRIQAGQKEVTAKRYRAKGRIIELAPESDDKRWTTPLILDPKKAPEGEEIAIIAIVVGVYKPLRRK